MNQFKTGIQNFENLYNVKKNLGVLVQNIAIWFPYYWQGS